MTKLKPRTKVICANHKVRVEHALTGYMQKGWQPVGLPWVENDDADGSETWFQRIRVGLTSNTGGEQHGT